MPAISTHENRFGSPAWLSFLEPSPGGPLEPSRAALAGPLDGFDRAPAPVVPVAGSTLFVQGAGDVDPVDFDDVSQGGLGDCYFMASVAALARKDPDAIRDMIRENRNAAGEVVSYTVTLYEEERHWYGLWLFGNTTKKREVTVDASFTTGGRANPGDMGSAGEVEVWPMVLEKAYAQMNGGYQAIEGGAPADAMFALTGRKASVIYGPYEPSFGRAGYRPGLTWEALNQRFNENRMIVFSTDGDDKQLREHGLHGKHAYVVDNVYTDASGRRMVHLTNPWGYEHADIPFDQLSRHIRRISIGG